MENKEFDIERFVNAQEGSYTRALSELREGEKRSYWMWYIFPQMRGLGRSPMANCYGISGLEEVSAYLAHPVLGPRLREVCRTILELPADDARQIFGEIDSHKLRSSMTLFDIVAPDDVFSKVLDKFFQRKRDRRTFALLNLPGE